MDIETTHIDLVVLGAGESGLGAAILADKLGKTVFVTDSGTIRQDRKAELASHKIAWEEGGHSIDKILKASLIVKSPGIPESSEVIKSIRTAGLTVISEIEWAFLNSDSKFIGITGTNGKTTTTNLIHHILESAGMDVGLAGNIGYSLARQVAEKECPWYVVELSSFQLDDMFEFRPTIALLLNITPDHLDRYDNDLARYASAKLRIRQKMGDGDLLVYWKDDPVLSTALENDRKPDGPHEATLSLQINGGDYFLEGNSLRTPNGSFLLNGLPLVGRHNALNMMAAIAVAQRLDISQEVISRALASFSPIPHRMEAVGTINGVRFFNDSKATNVEAVFFALEAFENRITWIAGGVDKGNDYSRLEDLVKKKVKALVCLGKDNTKLISTFGNLVSKHSQTTNIKEAAKKAYEYSEMNDVVLLSPACASFDLFKNYEDRGTQFREAVSELKQSLESTKMEDQS